MYSISDKQIDFILNDIRARGVEMEDLQYNLLDHVCCIIERELEANGNFEHFYQKTIKQFYKHELWEIEEETISLQLFKHYYTMKKIMIGSGIFSAITMIAGIIFKFMHWPGASMMIVLGIGSSSLIFLPLLLTLRIKEKTGVRDKIIIAIGTVSGILFSLGILFKVMHWPGANMMGMSAILIMLAIYLPINFVTGIRNPETKVNTVVSSIIIIMACGLFLTLVNSRPSIKIQNTIAFASENAESTYNFLTVQNEAQTQTALKDSINAKSVEQLSGLCRELCSAINTMKLDVVNTTEGLQTNKIDYYALQMHDNYTLPTNLFFDNMGAAKKPLLDLKKKLGQLNAMASNEFKINAGDLINLADRNSVHEDGMEPWEVSNFYHVTENMMLKNFTQLQINIRVIEANCLSSK